MAAEIAEMKKEMKWVRLNGNPAILLIAWVVFAFRKVLDVFL